MTPAAMRAYVATNPAKGKSWAQMFDDRKLYAAFQAWARAHPLHGVKIPLLRPISEVTRGGNMLQIKTLKAEYLDHCGADNWRFIGQYGNAHKRLGKRTYWVDESMIDWEAL